MIRTIRMSSVLLGLTLAFALPQAALAERIVDETRPMAAGGRLHLVAVVGQFEIIGSDEPELRITGTLGGEVRELSIEGADDRWEVELRTQSRAQRGNGRTQLVIAVPRGADVQARTVSGDLQLQGLAGRNATIVTVSGNVELREVRPDRLEVETVSGSQSLNAGGRSETRLKSVSGNIDVGDVAGRVRVNTVSGAAALNAGALDTLDIETVSGRIRVQARPEANASIGISSHSGSIRIELPADTGIDLRANTYSGRIRSAFGGQPVRGRGPGERLEHQSGDGRLRLDLRSFSGGIQVDTLD